MNICKYEWSEYHSLIRLYLNSIHFLSLQDFLNKVERPNPNIIEMTILP